MATTTNRPLTDQIRDCNARLDEALRQRVGICLETYKLIKNTTQLVGAIGVIFAIYEGADPMTAAFLIAVIISGPEAIEYVLTNGSGGQ